MKISLKAKLIFGYTVIIGLTGLFSTVIGTYLISRGVMTQAQESVRTDLGSAREMLQNRLDLIENSVRLSTYHTSFRIALEQGDRAELQRGLQELRRASFMQIAAITDAHGRVAARAGGASSFGDDQAGDALVAEVLKTRRAAAAVTVVSRAGLEREGLRAPGSGPVLALKAAAPFLGPGGEILGVIYGGDVINGNAALVDRMSQTLFRGRTYKGREMGRVSIFQGPARVATNVTDQSGARALGTRVPRAVRERVLDAGRTYTGRVFVLDAWYVTAYEPVRDQNGGIVGMLGVGLLERKFIDMRTRTLLVFFGVTILGMWLVLAVSNFAANQITRPVNYLVKVSQRISEGDFSVNVRVDSHDELGALEKAFNSMTTALRERDEELRKQTQQQLMRSEKLAALGRMAAGIAHEVNNPLTGVLMHGHFLLKRFPEDDPSHEDAHVVVRETTRCRDLLRNLLDFSRENIPQKRLAGVNRIIERTVSMVEKQILLNQIRIDLNLSSRVPETMADSNQMEQVIMNLLLNASESMAGGGTITVGTEFDAPADTIIITVRDTGCGIPPENLDKVFDPFFTTREVGKGTGLGLAVCYGIIKKHNGRIRVQSDVGSGACFTITIPVDKAEPS
jgi:two-component system NtrC family sensor kinase